MCGNLIYLTTTTAQTVNQDSIIPLTTITRRKGCAIQSGNNSVLISKPGYYLVNAVITFTSSVAGNATVELDQNGQAVVGATGTTAIATATTEPATITISSIVRVLCNQGITTLTLRNTGIDLSTSNVALSVVQIG